MKNAILSGVRCYLRPHGPADIDAWAAWFNDPVVTRYLQHGAFPNTSELQAARLQRMYPSATNFQVAIVEAATDALVGTVGLHEIDPVDRNAAVSVTVGNRDYWGKHFGREAVSLVIGHGFRKLNLHKLTAGMVADNVASLALFEELGFKREAFLREQLFRDGRYRDEIRLGLLKADWPGLPP
jgi:ribosomal-protein-alanine N-acetyltransferase